MIRRRAEQFRAWLGRHKIEGFVALLSAALVIVVLSARIFITVPAGSVGVLWLRFGGGTQLGFHYNPGLKIIAPWDKIYMYDARLRRLDETVLALTRDGLTVQIEMTISYFINRDLAPNLHEILGPQYEVTLIQPLVGSEVRNAVATLRPDDLYSINRVGLEEYVARSARTLLSRDQLDVGDGRQLFEVQEIFIRNISLPPVVRSAIEDKIAEEQNALRYQFVLERERLESQRKTIEAQGIRQFQDIVSSGISNQYLRWKGIEATLELSKSTNSKVIVIGSQNGLPLILDTAGNRDGALTPTPADAGKPPAKGAVPAPLPAVPSPAPSLNRP